MTYMAGPYQHGWDRGNKSALGIHHSSQEQHRAALGVADEKQEGMVCAKLWNRRLDHRSNGDGDSHSRRRGFRAFFIHVNKCFVHHLREGE